MNSETIIVGIVCLFLAAAFFLFKPQFFIFLNRLANMEFRRAENPQAKPEIVTARDIKPWTWRKAWTASLLHPNTDTSKVLTEDNVTFFRAYIWIVTASIIFQVLYSIISWIKFPYSINSVSILKFLEGCLLTGLFSPVIMVGISGFIHVIAKLFGGKEDFQRFFVVYVAFNAPVMILYIAIALIWQIFRIQIALYLGGISAFYFLLIVTTMAIKSYYHFSGLKAFFINLFVQFVSFFSIIGSVIMFYPDVIKR